MLKLAALPDSELRGCRFTVVSGHPCLVVSQVALAMGLHEQWRPWSLQGIQHKAGVTNLPGSFSEIRAGEGWIVNVSS